MSARILHVKSYVQGNYFTSDRVPEVLKNPVSMKILAALKSRYPEGMTANDLENTIRGQSTSTIHRLLGHLKKESFVLELEEKRRGEGTKPSSVHIIEDVGSTSPPQPPYRLAPEMLDFPMIL